jgi:spore coat polysaccharide biosynthesis predicted glycosyltransferase SpsG
MKGVGKLVCNRVYRAQIGRRVMKVKIFTEGGSKIGLGHISRCCSLYDEIAARGIMVEFIIFGNIDNVGFLQGRNVCNINWISSDFLNNYIHNIDYCIVDSYLATKELYQIISDRSNNALFFDDYRRMKYPKGIIVSPSLCNEAMHSNDDEHIYLSGAEFILLRPPFVNVKRNKRNSNGLDVLVTMGGSDIRDLTPNIINILCDKHPEINFHVVCNAYYNNDKLKKVEQDNVVLYYNIDAELMKELMLKSDFAIATAGQTLYELLATETQFIAIKVIENQNINIKGINKLIPSLYIINYDDEDFIGKLEVAFEVMLKKVAVDGLSNYKSIVDGKGSKRIVDALFSLRP